MPLYSRFSLFEDASDSSLFFLQIRVTLSFSFSARVQLCAFARGPKCRTASTTSCARYSAQRIEPFQPLDGVDPGPLGPTAEQIRGLSSPRPETFSSASYGHFCAPFSFVLLRKWVTRFALPEN